MSGWLVQNDRERDSSGSGGWDWCAWEPHHGCCCCCCCCHRSHHHYDHIYIAGILVGWQPTLCQLCHCQELTSGVVVAIWDKSADVFKCCGQWPSDNVWAGSAAAASSTPVCNIDTTSIPFGGLAIYDCLCNGQCWIGVDSTLCGSYLSCMDTEMIELRGLLSGCCT